MTIKPPAQVPLRELDEAGLALLCQSGSAPPQAWLRWAQAALADGEPHTALERIDLLERGYPFPDIAGRHSVRASALQSLGRDAEADVLLSDLVRQGHGSRAVWSAWAKSGRRLLPHAEAAERFGQCLQVFGDASPTAWFLDHYALLAGSDQHDPASASLARMIQSNDAVQRFPLDHPDPRVSDVLTYVAVRIGTQLARRLADDFTSTAAQAGAMDAVQQLRNVLHILGFQQVPPSLVTCLPSDLRPARLGSLRSVARLLEPVLVDFVRDPIIVPAASRGARVLIVAAYMPASGPGPHMRFINSYAAAFALRPEVVHVGILITQERGPEGPHVQDGPVDAHRRGDWADDMAFLSGPSSSKVTLLAPDRNGPVYSQADALHLAEAFQPDHLVAIQGIYASPVIAQVLARALPTVALQTSVDPHEVHYADLILAHGNAVDFADRATPAKWRRQPIPVVAFLRDGQPVEVRPTGAASVGVVTAVGSGRLERSLRSEGGELAAQMRAFLTAHEEVIWSLFGVDEPTRAASEVLGPGADDVLERLRTYGFVQNLRAHLAESSIYFQPANVTGGAMAVAMALEEGLAVVAPTSCDAANFLPDEWLYGTVDQGLSLLAALIQNVALRHHAAQVQLAHMRRHHSIEAVSDAMPDVLRSAAVAFSVRQSRHQ